MTAAARTIGPSARRTGPGRSGLSSAVDADAFGGDLEDDPLALDVRLVVRASDVSLGQRVDVGPCLRARDGVADPAADLGVVVRVAGVDHRHRHSGVLAHVGELLPVDLGVDEDGVVVGVHPHHLRRRLPAGQDGGEGGEVLAPGEVTGGGIEHDRRLRQPVRVGGASLTRVGPWSMPSCSSTPCPTGSARWPRSWPTSTAWPRSTRSPATPTWWRSSASAATRTWPRWSPSASTA